MFNDMLAMSAGGGGGMEFSSLESIKQVTLNNVGATYSLGSSPHKCVIGVYPFAPDNFASRVVVGNDVDGWKAPDLSQPSPSSSTGECGAWFDVPANSYFKSISGGWGFPAVIMD